MLTPRAQGFRLEVKMPSLKVLLGILAAGLTLSGCIQGATYEATNVQAFKPRDKELLAKTSYAKVAAERTQPANSDIG